VLNVDQHVRIVKMLFKSWFLLGRQNQLQKRDCKKQFHTLLTFAV